MAERPSSPPCRMICPRAAPAPSATTTIEKCARRCRCSMRAHPRTDVERHFRHQHDVGTAGHPGVDGDPPRVAAHHLHDHHPVVALGRRVEAVDGVGRDLHRGLEPEREVGGGEVVVDRLRDADHRDGRLVGEASGRPPACPRPRSPPGRTCSGRGCRAPAPPRRRTGTGWCATCRGSAATRQNPARRLDGGFPPPRRRARRVAEAHDRVLVVVDALPDDTRITALRRRPWPPPVSARMRPMRADYGRGTPSGSASIARLASASSNSGSSSSPRR